MAEPTDRKSVREVAIVYVLLGVVLSFMMGVTTLSLPSMIMLRKAVKPKLLWIFITICTVGIIPVGSSCK